MNITQSDKLGALCLFVDWFIDSSDMATYISSKHLQWSMYFFQKQQTCKSAAFIQKMPISVVHAQST